MTLDLEAMKKRAKEQPNASDTLRLVAEVERLTAHRDQLQREQDIAIRERDEADKAYEYELTERRACEAQIEAALAVERQPGDTDGWGHVAAMREALTGGREK